MAVKKSSYSRVKNAFKPISEEQLPFIIKYANVGKRLMENLQEVFLYGKIDEEMNAEDTLNLEAVVGWFKNNNYELLFVEKPIDDDQEWSGFIDVIARNKNNENILFEIKIRKDSKVELDTVVQAEFYLSMIKEIKISDYKILHLIRKNYEVVECEISQEQKKIAKEIIKKMKEIKKLWK